MLTRKALLIVTVALLSLPASCTTAFAQDGDSPRPSSASNAIYLADMKPAAIDKQPFSEISQFKARLDAYYKTGECALAGFTFRRSVSFGPNNGTWSAVFLPGRRYDYFEATIGVDDHYPDGSERRKVTFALLCDDKEQILAEDMLVGMKPVHVRVPIKDVGRLVLELKNRLDGDRFNPGDVYWGDARFVKGNGAQSLPSPNKSEDNAAGDPAPAEAGSKILRIEPDKLQELATQLKEAVADDPDLSKSKPTLAVAAFKLIPANTLAPDNADNVREDLSTALIKVKAFDVVERGQLDKALQELKIGLRDTFDSETAQKLGKLVHARAVLIGSISDRGTYTVINARLIDTETGKARIAASLVVQQ